MGKIFTFWYCGCILTALTVSAIIAPAQASQTRPDTTSIRLRSKSSGKGSYLKNGFHVSFPTFKAFTPSVKAAAAKSAADEKVLNNVQIFPNPVTDQINLKYTITKNTMVTISVMDVLGNSVLTLLQQRLDPGEQKFTYNLNKQLTSGFYFVRVNAGAESVIRRISVL
ncbi:T9SS type A sorting domain-containing protein [Mucilaginibacter ginkgonis]|uniref:T9SS type A sorting domain-containing protein n=1 Tax=Mucilaginibacter ginkgonis TaxID=2682091 RepID=A0A6I4IP40_9SPHI|nr:T9SS type A sorting domain-containing protein [Mucilaginibacter ginkgonis]QQL48496.1 T9SS type A sorting domain-containing protein [Mucilaginibacter ginkgonis]